MANSVLQTYDFGCFKEDVRRIGLTYRLHSAANYIEKQTYSRYAVTELDEMPDFAKIAAAYGIESAFASSNEEAEMYSEKMLKSDKPFLLVCNVHPNTPSR